MRSTPSSRRISASAWRPVIEIVSRAVFAWSGEVSITYAAPSACTTITDTLCATTSCSSRAIRARSAATATLACASRSRSRREARSSSCAKYALRVRIESPSTQARTNGTVMMMTKKTFSVAVLMPPVSIHRKCASGAAHSPPTSATREAQRSPAEATV